MKVTVIPIVVGSLGTVLKGFVRGLEELEVKGRAETIQTTAFLRSVFIQRRVLETWGDLLSLPIHGKTISFRWLLENWKNYGTWRWQLYQLWLVLLARLLKIIKGHRGFGSWRPSGDHPNNSIIEDDQNTEKSPGDLRRLVVTQSPVKDHQLTLMWKTLISKW